MPNVLFLLIALILAFGSNTLASSSFGGGSYAVYMDADLGAHRDMSGVVRVAGVATCLALSIYDKDSGWLYVAHISATYENEKFVQRALRFFEKRGVRPNSLQANIAGGWVSWSEPYLEDLKLALEESDIQLSSVAELTNVGFGVGDTLLEVDPAKIIGRPTRDFIFDFQSERLIETESI